MSFISIKSWLRETMGSEEAIAILKEMANDEAGINELKVVALEKAIEALRGKEEHI